MDEEGEGLGEQRRPYHTGHPIDARDDALELSIF